MTKHDPGPWNFDGRFVGSGHSKSNICECRDHSGCWTDSVDAIANARLIAAAPELLDALQGFVSLLRAPSSPIRSRALAVEVEKGRALIAKATGEQA